jgi:putative flippase GtrA
VPLPTLTAVRPRSTAADTRTAPPTTAGPSAGALRRLPAPVRALLGTQAGRFLVVGGVATVVDVGLFNVLHVLLALDPVLSKALSTSVAAVVAYVGNRSWSFDAGSDQAVGRQVVPYVVVTVVSLGISLVPVYVAREIGLQGVVAMNVAANLVGLGLATAFRFVGYQRWVFTAAPAASSTDRADDEQGDLRRAA